MSNCFPGTRHEFKAGLEYETTAARQEFRYPAGRIYYDFFGEPSQLEVWGGQAGQARPPLPDGSCTRRIRGP